ncbi:MAG: flavin reductase family protein [Microscillaceae bacterium]|nr:flavin reductase family protein [Microscillaceae bacterium]
MKRIDPQAIGTAAFHAYLLGAVAPRPIAFASTMDAQKQVNLSPFSFFNAFGSNPPTLIFSPARRVRNNTNKHTLENILEVPEVVINMVNFEMVNQMSLSSTEYAKGVNEFVKAGFTEVPSEKVRPPRVGESPAAFECKVKQIIETGQEGGAGNLIICEVVLAHIKPDILDEHGQIDPFKLDAVARMGGNWYCRAQGAALFEVEKPNTRLGIGIDKIPDEIRYSPVLTGNDLGQLGNIEQLPPEEEIIAFREQADLYEILHDHHLPAAERPQALHLLAQKYLRAQQTEAAWKILLQPEMKA